MARDFLLFTSDSDGEYYEGAFSSLELTKAIAFKRWDGDSHTSYIVRKTSNNGFSLYGETSYHKGVPYLSWSDETIKDIAYQKEKRDEIQARREREAEESQRQREKLEAKRKAGTLTSLEKISLSMTDAMEAQMAQMFDNLMNRPKTSPCPDGRPLVSASHQYDTESHD